MAEKRVDPGIPSTGNPGGNTSPPAGLYGGGGAPPPPVTTRKTTGERAVFTNFIRSHNGMDKWSTLIWNAASRYGGLTPTELAAVIWAESKGNPQAVSSVGALGVAQIYDNTANAVNDAGVPFFRDNHTISRNDKLDPAFSIQYMAWRLSGYASTHGGTIDDIWVGGYNPGYTGKPNYVSQYLPKGYVGTGGRTAVDKAGTTADTTAVETALKNPWVVGVSSTGKLRVVKSSVAPKNVVMYDGQPMQASDWQQLRRGLDQYFVSYTGGRPDNKTILQYVNKGWSPYSLTVALAKTKGFAKSPIYKSQAPQYQDAAKDLLPQGQKANQNLIRSAILNNWTAGAFQAVLRAQPGYVESNEFKSNTATLLNVHTSIYGVPDKKALNDVKQAAAAGWSPDQYASWLRSQDQYVQSPEYQSKALNFLSALGLITGQPAVLKKGQETEKTPYPSTGPLPTDKRLPQGSLSNPEDTVATYGS